MAEEKKMEDANDDFSMDDSKKSTMKKASFEHEKDSAVSSGMTGTETAAANPENPVTSDSSSRRKDQTSEVDISVDRASGHAATTKSPTTTKSRKSAIPRRLGGLLRCLLFDLSFLCLLVAYGAFFLLHQIHDEYLYPQMMFFEFQNSERTIFETTYYFRHCDGEDVSAQNVQDLVIVPNATTQDAVEHMLTHGASLYQNLLSPETATELREWIIEENQKQEGWYVIANEHRYSWGIDVNMHPKIHTYWKELASHEQFVKAIQAIAGPDPAIIEFTAITSAYGASEQFNHADVVPEASAAKYAQSFIPSYSLFIPLQDTTYDMGATHVCPGTHLCSAGAEEHCSDYNLAMSGRKEDGGVWKQGWGALVNQQTIHKGTAHNEEGGPDRVVLIATFAPRPQTFRRLETRKIGEGGSYSMLWSQWGHTFSDFVHADTRMTEPQKTLRSMGLLKGHGWTWPQVASMRMVAHDLGYRSDQLDDFIEGGGVPFLPTSWQGKMTAKEDRVVSAGGGDIVSGDFVGKIAKYMFLPETGQSKETKDQKRYNVNQPLNKWQEFLFGTLKRTERHLQQWIAIFVVGSLGGLLFMDIVLRILFRRRDGHSLLVSGTRRMALSCLLVAVTGRWLMSIVEDSNWAKDIKGFKAYQMPAPELNPTGLTVAATLPVTSDILVPSHYLSSHLSSYSHVLDFAHPGNKYWKDASRHYTKGYMDLSKNLQVEVCRSLINSVQLEHRFLIQDFEHSWIEVGRMSSLYYFCQTELASQARPALGALLEELQSLQMDTMYGRWQGSAMSEKAISNYLSYWFDTLLPPLVPVNEKNITLPRSKPAFLFVQSLGGMTKKSSKHNPVYSQRSILPSKLKAPEEPYPGAWLYEGDIVDVEDNCMTGEIYAGTIGRIYPSEGVMDVAVEMDGEMFTDVDPYCVVRFEPYYVGEALEVRVGKEEYVKGKITRIYSNDAVESDQDGNEGTPLYFEMEIEATSNDGTTGVFSRKDIRPWDLRRCSGFFYQVGDLVHIRDPDNDSLYPATIVAVLQNGRYEVEYEDGEYETNVPRGMIVPYSDDEGDIDEMGEGDDEDEDA